MDWLKMNREHDSMMANSNRVCLFSLDWPNKLAILRKERKISPLRSWRETVRFHVERANVTKTSTKTNGNADLGGLLSGT